MQRRLSIAMALISEPRILFLDEPTLGLDVLARRELWTAIKRLKGKVTIVLTTHYMEEAQALADRIGIMVKGKMAAVGTVSELIEQAALGVANTLEDAFIALSTQEDGAL
ncbi:MAG: AAA family ATPase, partial [Sphaerochaetaceae bacterium]